MSVPNSWLNKRVSPKTADCQQESVPKQLTAYKRVSPKTADCQQKSQSQTADSLQTRHKPDHLRKSWLSIIQRTSKSPKGGGITVELTRLRHICNCLQIIWFWQIYQNTYFLENCFTSYQLCQKSKLYFSFFSNSNSKCIYSIHFKYNII